MSGCTSCVWLDYAEDTVKFYAERGGADVRAIIDEVERNVDDPMVKAFVVMEIRTKYK